MITAEIVKVDQDEQGALRVWASYNIDGVAVESNYPKIDGHSVYCTRYDALQFDGKTDAEIKDFILSQSQQYCEALVRKEYTKVANVSLADRVKSIVGQTVSLDEVKVSISPTEEVIVKQDGTKGEVSLKVVVNAEPLIG
jgi:hypothetical protein